MEMEFEHPWHGIVYMVRLRNMEVHIQLVCCNLVSTKRRAECVLRAREIR